MQSGQTDLDDVRIFNEVVLARSFTKAAKKLALPKSTVSRRVGKLEDRLGVLLLQRTTRKLNLTHAGELYYARTAHLLDELEEAEAALLELQSEPRGLLKISTPEDLDGMLFPIVTAFQERYPLVQLVIFATGRRVDLVEEGYDLALRASPPAQDSSMMSRTLFRSMLALYASPTFVAQHGTPAHPKDLSQYRCVIFSNDSVQDVWRLSGPEGTYDVQVRGRLAARDVKLLRAVAERGEGIALLPDISAAKSVREGTLVRVLPDYHGGEGSLRAVYPSPRHLSPKVRAFIDFVAEWLAKHRPDLLICGQSARGAGG